jgi:hypothetical protein
MLVNGIAQLLANCGAVYREQASLLQGVHTDQVGLARVTRSTR